MNRWRKLKRLGCVKSIYGKLIIDKNKLDKVLGVINYTLNNKKNL